MKLDDVLKHVGEFGLYQKRLYALIVLPSIFHACQQMNYVFLLGQHDHSCKLPSQDNRSLLNLPNGTHSDLEYFLYNGNSTWVTECEIYTYDNVTNSSTTQPCTSWEYDTSYFTSSATSEFNLVCENKAYKSHASMTNFFGGLTATLVMGTLGDVIGRRVVLCVAVTVMFLSDLALAWSPNIYIFSAIHFLNGFSGIAYFGIAVISVLELVGPSKRTMAGLVIEMVWSVGIMILCLVAYFIRNWRYLQIAISAPSFLFLFYWIIIPESPRWLLARGRKDQALKIIRKIAFVNKTALPENVNEIECEREFKFREVVQPLLRSKTLMTRWLVLTSSWFVIAMAYFGLSYNVGRIGGDIYVNFLLSAIVEFIGYLLCMLLSGKFGRKPVQSGSLIISGLGCFGCIAATVYGKVSFHWLKITMSMIGKCGVSAAFGNVFIYTPELFPTYVRSFITGSCNTGARIGTLISPYIANIVDFVPNDVGHILPYIIFGGVAICVGLVSMTLPETLNTHLPETIEEAIMLKRKIRRDDSKNEDNKDEALTLETFS